MSSLALLAFVASAASTLSLQSDILSIVVFPLTTIFFNHTCCLGRLSWATFLKYCLQNTHFGIALACWRTRRLWNHRLTHLIAVLFLLLAHSKRWLAVRSPMPRAAFN